MWVLKSFSKVVVAGPFKSEAEMAKKLGVSQQYVNRKIRKHDRVFSLDGKRVIAIQEANFVACGTNIEATTQADLALKLGVPPDAVAKVLRKKTSGVVQTPKGEVKIQRLKPGRNQFFRQFAFCGMTTQKNKIFFPLQPRQKNSKSTPKPSRLRSRLGEILSRENLMGKNSQLKFREKQQG